MKKLRIATYNIHKCRGLDRKLSPSRIVDVLRETDADVVALQEVVSLHTGSREENQARFIAEELEMEYCIGETRKIGEASYGNVLLSRMPLRDVYNYDLSVRGRERRGCMRADIEINDKHILHIFNVHLGTALLERRHQGRKLVNAHILNNEALEGSRICLGDFNEWTRGLTTRLLSSQMRSADVRLHLRRSKTYPGVAPFLHLDHIYFDQALEMERLHLHRTRLSLVASDHLPLVADFHINSQSGERASKTI